jgi:hypothetical protein
MNYEVIPDIKPSFAEQKIIDRLTELDVIFEREVCFDDCRNPDTGIRLRFDFYFPAKEILMEYDGVAFHADTETKRRDRIKNDFAKSINVKIVRISGISNAIKWVDKMFFDKKKLLKPKPQLSKADQRIIQWQKDSKRKNQRRAELRELLKGKTAAEQRAIINKFKI